MQNKKGNILVITLIIVIVVITAGIIGWKFAKKTPVSIQTTELPKTNEAKNITQSATEVTNQEQSKISKAEPATKLSETTKAANWLTYKNEKYGFQFKYPKNWFLDKGRLSPQKIEEYEIGSDNAPVSFGVYTNNQNLFLNSPGGPANPEILDFGNYEFQIKESKRIAPDSSVEVNGIVFKRYDLVDYGRYEGDSAGNVILFVGPNLKNQDLFVVFEWQQFPGGKTLKINNSQDFIDVVSTLRYSN